MPPSIGTATVDVMIGRPLKPALGHDVKGDRVAQDDLEVRQAGYRSTPVEIRTMVTAVDAAAATTAAEAHRDLKSTIVTVTDADGQTHADCLVEEAVPEIIACLKPTVNPVHTRMIMTQWRIRRLYRRP